MTGVHTSFATAAISTPCRLGVIGFVNTLPVYNTSLKLPEQTTLVAETPAGLNRLIGEGELDISPVSAAYYLAHQDELVLLPAVSVSSFGGVESVLYLTHPKASPTEPVCVPDDSATSVAVLKSLLARQQGSAPIFRTIAASQMVNALAEGHSGLVIGDRALQLYAAYLGETEIPLPQGLAQHQWMDMATAWHQTYGVPIVFAVWVVRKAYAAKYPQQVEAIVQALTQARDQFFTQPALETQAYVQAQRHVALPEATLHRYWHTALNYQWTPDHAAGLAALANALGLPVPKRILPATFLPEDAAIPSQVALA